MLSLLDHKINQIGIIRINSHFIEVRRMMLNYAKLC